jgi:hypothetical protein
MPVLAVPEKDQIAEWLRAIGSTPTETADPHSAWRWEVDYPTKSSHRMVVANPVGAPAATVIATGLTVAPEHLRVFANLEDEEKQSFLLDLRQKANSVDVDFQFFGVTNPLDCPSKIQLSVTRYPDGLTLDSFARSIGAVFKTELSVAWLVQQRLGGEDEPGTGRKFDFKRLGY